jgi:hypothetical protein
LNSTMYEEGALVVGSLVFLLRRRGPSTVELVAVEHWEHWVDLN